MEKEMVTLVDLRKEFGETEALAGINLSIQKNEFLTLLGPSGCGKTTALRIIGGFETPTSGQVLFDGKDITSLPPYKRKVNTVFQKYSLFPNMNVFENIAFGLRLRKMSGTEISEKVAEMLKLINLPGYENRSVDTLSGGQQQRVAIARALVLKPEVLLLDEPLGALDLQLRKDMQIELKKIQKALGITFIFVTHDQEEALTMSDTVVVMKDGKIQQKGTPIDIYNEPTNAFVADFIGESNILDGIMKADYLVHFFGVDFTCEDKGFAKDEPVDVVIRPEDVKIVPVDNAPMKGTVTSVTFKGVHYEMQVDCCDFNMIIHSTLCEKEGSYIGMDLGPNDIHIMKKS